jgi:hypothetical protein
MTAIAVSDWTVVINKTLIKGGQRENQCTLTYGDGALTYPTAGIPMPTVSSLGMQRHIDSIHIVSSGLDAATTTAYRYQYDKTNHLLQIFIDEDPAGTDAAFVEGSSSLAPAASTLKIVVTGY